MFTDVCERRVCGQWQYRDRAGGLSSDLCRANRPETETLGTIEVLSLGLEASKRKAAVHDEHTQQHKQIQPPLVLVNVVRAQQKLTFLGIRGRAIRELHNHAQI